MSTNRTSYFFPPQPAIDFSFLCFPDNPKTVLAVAPVDIRPSDLLVFKQTFLGTFRLAEIIRADVSIWKESE